MSKRTEIERLIALGKTTTQIVAAVGCHEGYVRCVRAGNADKKYPSDLKRENEYHKRERERRAAHSRKVKKMIARRKAGATLKELAEEFGYKFESGPQVALKKAMAHAAE